MDRQLVYKSTHNIGLKNRVGTAQNLFLGTNQVRNAGAGPFTLTSTIQRPALLQTISIDCLNAGAEVPGTVSDITIAGQSCFTSDSVVGISCFSSKSFSASSRALGVSVQNNMQVTVTGNTLAAGNVGVAIGLDPIPQNAVKSRAQQAHAYNFIHGLGTVTVGPGATAVLSSVSTRNVTLGEIILSNNSATPSDDLLVESIKISGLEMLAGPTGATQIPFSAFENSATMTADLVLGYPIEANARVEIQVRNVGAAGAPISGGIFCVPWK